MTIFSALTDNYSSHVFRYLCCGNADGIKPCFNANEDRSADRFKTGYPVPFHGILLNKAYPIQEFAISKGFGLVSTPQSRKQTVQPAGLG